MSNIKNYTTKQRLNVLETIVARMYEQQKQVLKYITEKQKEEESL